MIVWISDDKQYYAVPFKDNSIVNVDVYSKDGQTCWIGSEPVLKDVRKTLFYNHPHKIIVWSNLSRWTRGDKRNIKAFSVTFWDCNITIPFNETKANKEYHASFHKKIHIKKSLLKIPEGINYD
ncbi:MAG: hypothetical protein WC389_18800 [Lutibacter sp.]|jgi:hypothetical protein